MRQRCLSRSFLRWPVMLWGFLAWVGMVFPAVAGNKKKLPKPSPKKKPPVTRVAANDPPPTLVNDPSGADPAADPSGGFSTPRPKPNRPKGKPVDLTILYTTDLYGQFRDFRCKRPGVKGYKYSAAKRDVSNLLQLVAMERNKLVKQGKVPPYLFNTGDNLGSSLAARFLLEFEGLAGVDFIARVFKRFSYDVIGLGNHEFTPAKEKLEAFLSQASSKGLRFLASNLKVPDKKKKPLLYKKFRKHAVSRFVNDFSGGKMKPYFVFEPERGGLKTGIKVGVFHLLPSKIEAAKGNLDGISFEDPGTVASTIAETLRDKEKVDVVVMLSHLGSKVKEVVLGASGIDLVITNSFRTSGKASSFSVFDKKGKGVYIVSGTKFGSQLGKVILKVQRFTKGRAKVVAFQPGAIPMQTNKYDQELRRELIKWETSYCKRWGKPLGTGRIRPGFKMTKKQFAVYLLNLLRSMSHTELAFINKRALRSLKIQVAGQYGMMETVTRPFPLEGYITKDDIYRALPFDQGFKVVKIKGSVVNELMGTHSEKFYFAGGKDSKVNARDVSENGTYTAITIDFIVNKGMRGVDLKVNPREVRNFRYKNGSRVKLRELLIQHFARDRFKKLPKAPPPKKEEDPFATDDGKKKKKKPPPKPFASNEIPHTGEFFDLTRRFALKLTTTNELVGTGGFISPINISAFGFSELQDQNFQKLQGNVVSELKLEGSTIDHYLRGQFNINYNVYSASQWIQEPAPGRVQQSFFREEMDELKLTGEYVYKYFETQTNNPKWYYPSPSFQYVLTTEVSRGPRPDLTGWGFGDISKQQDGRYFSLGNATEVYRKFEMEARLGVKFKVGKERNLNIKISGSLVRNFALQFCIKAEKTPDGQAVKDGIWCDGDPGQQPQGQVDRSYRAGLSLEYSHDALEIGKIGGRAVTWTSQFEYRWNVSLLSNFYRDSHKLRFDNEFAFEIQGNLKLAFGLKFTMYNDFFRPTTDGTLIRGPLAFAVIPSIKLTFNWFHRIQGY